MILEDILIVYFKVIGTDLSPIQPKFVPPNLKFIVDDIEAEWLHENNPFDFIHARYLAASIKDFPKLLRQCYKFVYPFPSFSPRL